MGGFRDDLFVQVSHSEALNTIYADLVCNLSRPKVLAKEYLAFADHPHIPDSEWACLGKEVLDFVREKVVSSSWHNPTFPEIGISTSTFFCGILVVVLSVMKDKSRVILTSDNTSRLLYEDTTAYAANTTPHLSSPLDQAPSTLPRMASPASDHRLMLKEAETQRRSLAAERQRDQARALNRRINDSYAQARRGLGYLTYFTV